MSVRYWVLVTSALMDSDPQWPAFLRPVERLRPIEITGTCSQPPGAHWWLFEDDEAPQTLNGKRIELTAWTQDGELQIARRLA